MGQQQGHEFKYHVELAAFSNCPPPAALEPLDVGYRFATANLTDSQNSLPVYKVNPSRWVGERKRPCCSMYALSMFSSKDALIKRAEAGLANSPKFLKRVGDHYVQLSLKAECGRQTKVGSSGHFDLHEYLGFDFSSSVQTHEELGL